MAAPMSASVIKSCLSAVPLFSSLTDAELTQLASAARVVTFRKGARVFEEGAPADCCYVVVAGRAKVVLDSESGDEVALGEVAPGDLVGEVALLDGFTRSAALVAAETCRLIVIPATAFDSLRSNPAFERRLVARVMSTLRDSTEHVRSVATGPSLTRVVWCLGRIARREGKRDGTSVIIPKKPHHELASMAGCTRETVSRALGTLKRKKYVSWDSRTMRLEDTLQRYLRPESLVRPATARRA